jgi:hypothetical protein
MITSGSPRPGHVYRKRVAGVLLRRAVAEAYGNAARAT